MFGLLDESLGFVINKTSLALKNAFERRLKPLEITAVQFSIMKRLWEEDGLSQKEIAERTFKKTAEITHLIDKLEKKGFVVRQGKENSRREYRILLTDKGKAIETQAIYAAYATLEQALEGVETQEADKMLVLLEKIFTNTYGK